MNPGFDRDFSGWDLRNEFYPAGDVGASAQWVATDVLSGNSGSVRFQLKGYSRTVNRVLLSQCVAAVPGRRYTGGGFVRTDSQIQYGVIARLELYTSAGCAGNPVAAGPPDGYSLRPMPYTANDSRGRWLPGSASAVAGAGVQSLRFSAGIDAVTGSYYSLSSFDGLFDDAFLFQQTDPAAAWILPSSANVSGAAGSSWTTTLTLTNAGADDALVTLRFLGHDRDGRSGDERSLSVRAGTVVDLPDVLGTLFGRTQDFGAIRIFTSSASVAVQSETSTPSSSGTVGQALPAFGPADFAGATPKTLAPIRDNAFFRTNLVLANATEAPLVAHVALFAADGLPIGSRDVDLPPLGMTQINHVANALGASTLGFGRIAVSTPTPGGLVAAYASIIDNTTNDPRTLLPQETFATVPGPNLVANPGFDKDVSSWAKLVSTLGYATSSVEWSSPDASGNPASGSLAFHAFADIHDGVQVLRWQCVPVTGGDAVTFGAKFLTARQSPGANTYLGVGFFTSGACAEYWNAFPFASVSSLISPSSGETSSQGKWLSAAANTAAPSDAHSMGVYVGAFVKGSYDPPYLPSSTAYVDAAVDDVFIRLSPPRP